MLDLWAHIHEATRIPVGLGIACSWDSMYISINWALEIFLRRNLSSPSAALCHLGNILMDGKRHIHNLPESLRYTFISAHFLYIYSPCILLRLAQTILCHTNMSSSKVSVLRKHHFLIFWRSGQANLYWFWLADDEGTNWQQATTKTIDQATDPFHETQIGAKAQFPGPPDTRLILREFCSNALDIVIGYLGYVNNDVNECPRGYAWVVKSVQIARTKEGQLSCKEFSVIFSIVKKETAFKQATGEWDKNSVSMFDLQRQIERLKFKDEEEDLFRTPSAATSNGSGKSREEKHWRIWIRTLKLFSKIELHCVENFRYHSKITVHIACQKNINYFAGLKLFYNILSRLFRIILPRSREFKMKVVPSRNIKCVTWFILIRSLLSELYGEKNNRLTSSYQLNQIYTYQPAIYHTAKVGDLHCFLHYYNARIASSSELRLNKTWLPIIFLFHSGWSHSRISTVNGTIHKRIHSTKRSI